MSARIKLAGLTLAIALAGASVAIAAEGKGAGATLPAATAVTPATAVAASNGGAADARQGSVTDQIMALRHKMREAVQHKDRAALEALYHDRFTHLRETGRAETRKQRIDFLLSGQNGIELASADQALIETFSPDTAVLSGVSVIRNKDTRKNGAFQWLTLYVRDKDGRWQVALSQANRLPKPE